MNEFNLYDKRHVGATESNGDEIAFYREKDVKEFIRLLKEALNSIKMDEASIFYLIDSLAGDKLI